MIKVSDYIAGRLVEYGVKHVFMVTGGGAMHLDDSVGRRGDLEYICNHHEQACAIAAEGYARMSGNIGVVLVTSGPGGTNTLTGVIGQWLDSVPVLYLSGQVKRETTIEVCRDLGLRQLGDQEINIIDIVKPVTKYSVMVKDPLAIGYHLDKALYLAAHGRPGPVWLDIPLDIQAAMIDEKDLIAYNPAEHDLGLDRHFVSFQITELLDRLRRAESPVLMAGQGIRISGAADRFLELAERLSIPVLTSICGHDLICSSHPLFFGRPGICGDRIGNIMVQNCDFLLAIGARMGIRVIGYNYANFAPNAYKVMVDIDKAELNKPTLDPDMRIHADAGFFIDELLRQLDEKDTGKKREWIEWGNERKRALPTMLQDNKPDPGYVSSYVFADILFDLLGEGSVIVTGNGSAYTSTFQIMQIKKGMRVIANQGCASMGYDIPAAIGASVAIGRKPVILITGDGSIQMNIQELGTVSSYNLPLKIFVLENKSYLSIKTTQKSFFGGFYVGSTPESGVVCPDIRKIAKAYGLKTAGIRCEKGMKKKLKEILAQPGAAVCEISMDPEQSLYPKVSSAAGPDGKIVSRPLEDMFPFLSPEELKRCYYDQKILKREDK